MSAGEAHHTAAHTLLRSLKYHGVEYIFGNFGTDHPPILEAAATLRAAGREDEMPEFVVCPHETSALSAAHGAASATGKPQAVIVHVDVGTLNLGGMIHNAHRGNAPVFMIAGEAPVSHGSETGARNMGVHYLQDVFDQHGIVREYVRWQREYRPPADPDELVTRGLRMATNPRQGPVYLTAARESLEAKVSTRLGTREVQTVDHPGADPDAVQTLVDELRTAEAPLVVTGAPSVEDPAAWLDVLTEFAETVGAGVVEATPTDLCFPRQHEQHLGFIASRVLEPADLILLLDADIPWVPSDDVGPQEDATIIQVDHDPLKRTYPQWDVDVDTSIEADPAKTLESVLAHLPDSVDASRRETWTAIRRDRRDEFEDGVADAREEGVVTADLVTDTLDTFIDEDTVVVSEMLLAGQQLDLREPGSYYGSHGSALGWAPGAAVGVKLVEPDKRVISLVGDGTYIFANPTSAGWMSGALDAPTLNVVYNNSGWNAVKRSTVGQHPEGNAAVEGIPESKFEPRPDLTQAAHVVDAFSETIEHPDEAESVLTRAIEAVDEGTPAVVDARLSPI